MTRVLSFCSDTFVRAFYIFIGYSIGTAIFPELYAYMGIL